jgi:hypothetical protein
MSSTRWHGHADPCRGPWKGIDDLEIAVEIAVAVAVAEYIDRFNHRQPARRDRSDSTGRARERLSPAQIPW